MIKLKITKIENTSHTLEDDKNKYNVNIIFYGEKTPKENDIIYIPEKILQEINIYAYGPLNSKYSKNIDNEEEFIKIVNEKEDYYLQRYYG